MGAGIEAARTTPMNGLNGADDWVRAYVSSSTLSFSGGTTHTDWWFEGTIELTGEPTW